MQIHLIKRITIIVLLLTIPVFCNIYAGEQAETERLIKRIGPPPIPTEKDNIYADVYYEPSDILQGSNTGRWSEITETIGYTHQNINGYISLSQFDRLDVNDYAVSAGSYLTFKDQYAHVEAGFGWDIDYIYKTQVIAEYARRLYPGLYWQAGYNYRNYNIGDSHIFYPGLIYYFGDHYLSADYGLGFIDGRDTAQFGTVKGNFAITKFLRLWSGVAFGERLYDIFGLDSHDEFGYIVFSGVTLRVYKDISIRAGASYSQEDPKFTKRSLNLGASVKF